MIRALAIAIALQRTLVVGVAVLRAWAGAVTDILWFAVLRGTGTAAEGRRMTDCTGHASRFTGRAFVRGFATAVAATLAAYLAAADYAATYFAAADLAATPAAASSLLKIVGLSFFDAQRAPQQRGGRAS